MVLLEQYFKQKGWIIVSQRNHMYINNNASGKVYRNTYVIKLNDCALHTALLGLPSQLEVSVQESIFLKDEAKLKIFLNILHLVKLYVVDISQQPPVLH
jgi:hypothetical protein